MNDWAKLLPIAEFAYNNAKNAITSPILFKFNCGYYLKMLFENEVNFCLKFCSDNELAKELRKQIIICY